MYCKKCGAEINENEQFCSKCGCKIENILEIEEPNSITDLTSLSTKSNSVVLNNNRKFKIIGLIASIIVILIIAVAFCLHINSSSYKIDKSVQLIQEGNYIDSIDKISNVYEPQAEVIRDYINVLQAKDDFLNCFDSTVLMTNEHQDIVEKADAFKSKLYEFSDNEQVYFLPEELRKQFDYYIEFCHKIDLTYSDDYQESIYSIYYQPQNVFLNYPTRNRSDEYTLSDMQYNIDTSKSGVEVLKDWINNEFEDFSNAQNKIQGLNDDICPSEFQCFYNSTKDLISSCEDEIESEESYIEESLKKFDIDDRLYLKNPDKTATSYVIYDVEEIADMSNTGNNATIFQNTYYVDMMAYCLNNE